MKEKSYSKKSYSDNTLEEKSISLLEWDSLKTHLSSFASTEMGKRSILSFVIPSEYESSQRLLNETVEINELEKNSDKSISCLLYTSPSPRDKRQSRMPSSA